MALLRAPSTIARISNTSKILPELEGLRAVAALGIVVTHVAFQTASGSALLERFDYFVAVFFALSAFLLARGPRRDVRSYFRHRFARIAPAYLACVTVVMLALPSLSALTAPQALANLFMAQIYIPGGLIPGLTQLWSLCIEVAFYAVLPLYLLLGRGGRAVAIATAVVFALVWPWLIEAVGMGFEDIPVNAQIWPPSYAPWSAVGLVCAEIEHVRANEPAPRHAAEPRFRWVFPLCGLGVAWLAGQSWVGPRGLEHPDPFEFNARIILGTVFAALFVAPYALWPRGRGFLASPAMRALGKWSYSIFLWHVAVLEIAFPVLGMDLFTGSVVDFACVLAFTVAASVAVAYVSYELVERPARQAIATHPARAMASESPA